MTAPSTIRVDVTEALQIEGPHELALWAFAPERLNEGSALVVCLHGGSYSKHYWHFPLPGFPGYSFAEHLAAKGHVVVAWDALGTGESSVPPDPWKLTSVEIAQAGDALVVELRARLAAGALIDSLEPWTPTLSVGIGHSLGGLTLTRQQGRFATFDAVAVLGWTNERLVLSDSWHEASARVGPAVEELVAGREPAEAERLLHRLRDLPPRQTTSEHRASVEQIFHWPDVPRELIDADRSLAAIRVGAITLVPQIPGIVRDDAARITAPVFLGFGARDISPEPRAEPAYYRSCNDLTFHLLERAGHCHNFASTRQIQWVRIAGWIDGLSDFRRGA